jgi:uncharacterized protein
MMHLIRLLLSGVEVLKHGFVPLRVDEYRDRLLAIRRGELSWQEVEHWRLDLHASWMRQSEQRVCPNRREANPVT